MEGTLLSSSGKQLVRKSSRIKRGKPFPYRVDVRQNHGLHGIEV